MYDEGGRLLYIGLARHIARRLNSWFKYKKRQDPSLPWTSFADGSWHEQPKQLQTIKVNHPHEAPSLEAFLIGQLNPPENIHMKHRSDFAVPVSTGVDIDG
jgi:excinuclease UvrABC nuclease subunit